MNDLAQNMSNKAKSFWNRPEGVTGWIMIGVIAAIIIYFWGVIAPFILSMLVSTTKIAILLGIFAVVIGILSDKKMRTALGAVFKGIARTITNMVIKIDPLGILKDHISKLKKYLDEINTQLEVINGQAKSLSNAIEKNKQDINNKMNIIKVAKTQGKIQDAQLAMSDITRKKNSIDDYVKLLNKMQTIYKFLCKMRDNSNYILQDTVAQVDEEERKYKTINAAASALGKVKKFFSNDDELYNDTLAALQENIYDNQIKKIVKKSKLMAINNNYLLVFKVDF